jgi:hypothetical protein
MFDRMAGIEAAVLNGELRPDAARVILESQRWRAEKLKPRVYGRTDRLEHVVRTDLQQVSLGELKAQVAQLIGHRKPQDVVDVESKDASV